MDTLLIDRHDGWLRLTLNRPAARNALNTELLAQLAIALMGALNPLYVLPSALFFGFLETGALAMQRQVGVPSSLVLVIQGLTMIFVLCGIGRSSRDRT